MSASNSKLKSKPRSKPKRKKDNKIPHTLVLTPGDPSGIGPEITWKAIQSGDYHLPDSPFSILCVGAEAPFKSLGAPILKWNPDLGPLQFPKTPSKSPFIWLLPAPDTAPAGVHLEGFQSGWSIERATQLVLNKQASALVTGPISKERLQGGGFNYPGHTEFLAHLCKTDRVTMMLANETLRVTLVTIHVGIQNVSKTLTQEKLKQTILQTAEALTHYWGIAKPRLAITGLNPHAGESGLFGREEIEVIHPVIQALQGDPQNKFEVSGPFAADTLFAKHYLLSIQEAIYEKIHYDAVVCMYHDQGLIPVKLLDFYKTVNVTLGLPMIRTSVDHGVGFDIAGKGVANPSSLCAAIDLAARFANKVSESLI